MRSDKDSPHHVFHSHLGRMGSGFHPLHPMDCILSKVTDNLLTAKSKGHFSVFSPLPVLNFGHIGHASQFLTLPLGLPEWNSVLMLLLSERSSYLVGSSLFYLPFTCGSSPGMELRPSLFFIPRVHSEHAQWRLCFSCDSQWLPFPDFSRSILESPLIHPVILNSLLSPFSTLTKTCHLLLHMFWVFFSSIPTAVFSERALIIAHLNSLRWSPASFPAVSRLLHLQPTPYITASALFKTERSSLSCQKSSVATIHSRDKVQIAYSDYSMSSSFSFCLLLSAGCSSRFISTERPFFLKPTLVISHLCSDCPILFFFF